MRPCSSRRQSPHPSPPYCSVYTFNFANMVSRLGRLVLPNSTAAKKNHTLKIPTYQKTIPSANAESYLLSPRDLSAMAFGPGDLVIQNVYGDLTWLQRIFRHTPPCGGFSRSPLLVATLCPKVFQRIVVTTISTQTACIASALYHYVTMYHRPNVIQNENQHVNIPLQTKKMHENHVCMIHNMVCNGLHPQNTAGMNTTFWDCHSYVCSAGFS